MVVHISAGHHTGTLVNALLNHCGLPGIVVEQIASGSSRQTENDLQLDGFEDIHMKAEDDSNDPSDPSDDEDEGVTEPLLLPETGLPGLAPQLGGVLRPGR